MIESIATDQKRVARGEHLKLARDRLRVRDQVHHCHWKVLMIAGPEPEGELKAIKELMPSSHILCVDLKMECVVKGAAIADAILCCDLSPVQKKTKYGSIQFEPNPELLSRGPFDLVDLDLCGNPSSDTGRLVRVNSRLLTTRGVLMVTFSYGRDVVPWIDESYRKLKARYNKRDDWKYASAPEKGLRRFIESSIPQHLKSRIASVLDISLIARLRSVIQYHGKNMPMCSLLINAPSSSIEKISFCKLDNEDFENVMLENYYGDPCLIYDCPEERLLFLRRSATARKAVITRQRRIKEMELLPEFA